MNRPFLSRMVLVLAGLVLLQGCAYISLDLGSFMEFQPFEERVIKDGSADKVMVVEVLGPITTTAFRDSFMPRQGTLERVEAIFEAAKKDSRIKGIILKIDSPGGGVTASDLLFKEINAFKEKQKVPVVACITGQGTSGAYMAALSADSIVALPSAVVGNVGVLLPSISLEGLMDKLGIKNQTLTSGKLKDSGTFLRDMNQEDKAILEGIVTEFHQDFVAKVKATRPVTPEDLAVIADGRIMTASTGVKYHLIDQVGYYEDALKTAEALSKVKDPTVVVYRRRGENKGGFYSWP
ncbi:MAG TPA: signal peptide peptidase SppA [Deltaproteobacteria bacterium]|nr:signal peptide peptidase SppA [Deltaproteobacteria bacterium]HPR56406.1 signal peptide peptidase SppA [Deltaproteobacteria bacterium]HXK48402.1 signal peptide peptidase SppA [Deltaproteobacteria bacterium]